MDLVNGLKDVHIDAALSEMSVQLPIEQGLIQEAVCPSHPVKNESDKYFVFDRVGGKEYNVNVGLGAEMNQFKLALSTDSFSCDEYGIGSPLPFRMLKEQDDQIDLEMSAVEDATRIIRFARERRVVKLIQTVANWTGTKAIATAWDAAGADIEADMDAATAAFHLQAGIMANTAVISIKVYRAIVAWLRDKAGTNSMADYRNMEFILDNSGVATQLSGLFSISKWIVGSQISDAADVGEDYSGSYMWADMVTLLYIKENAGRRDRTACKTFVAENMTVRKYIDQGKRSLIVEASHIVDEKVVAKTLGYTLTSVLT